KGAVRQSARSRLLLQFFVMVPARNEIARTRGLCKFWAETGESRACSYIREERRHRPAGPLSGHRADAAEKAMALKPVSLDDKYDLSKRHVFVTGYQALIRLCMMQKERDRLAGLNTGGYVSGYRGSPLGGLDQQFMRAQPFLDQHDVVFQTGLNEDLAATALWGTQQAELHGEGKFDGVFGIWYGKGPGVDRTGDVFRHANLAG